MYTCTYIVIQLNNNSNNTHCLTMIVMEEDLINAGKHLLMAVLPAGGTGMMRIRLLVTLCSERQRVAKFPIAICRWPSMHNNATLGHVKVNVS